MARKKKALSDVVKKVQETPLQLSIEERLAGCGRNEPEHIVYVGNLVEKVLKSEMGAIIKALTAGRISTELSGARDGRMSSDRILGRLEMAENLWNDLEQFVLDKDRVQRPKDYNEATQSFNYVTED